MQEAKNVIAEKLKWAYRGKEKWQNRKKMFDLPRIFF